MHHSICCIMTFNTHPMHMSERNWVNVMPPSRLPVECLLELLHTVHPSSHEPLFDRLSIFPKRNRRCSSSHIFTLEFVIPDIVGSRYIQQWHLRLCCKLRVRFLAFDQVGAGPAFILKTKYIRQAQANSSVRSNIYFGLQASTSTFFLHINTPASVVKYFLPSHPYTCF